MGTFIANAKFGKIKLSLKSLLMGFRLFFCLFLETSASQQVCIYKYVCFFYRLELPHSFIRPESQRRPLLFVGFSLPLLRKTK